MDKINILGINVTKLSRREAIENVKFFLSSNKQHQIVTPNPEIILNAIGNDEELFYILNHADLAVPDGFGLNCAAWAMFKNLHRVAGSDLILDILKIAEKNNKKALVLVWDKGLSSAQDIEIILKQKFSNLDVLVKEIDRRGETINFTEVNDFKPDLVITGLGAPWQEKFNFHNLKNIPSAKLAIGVGGSFDFLTGKIKRAPKVMKFIGLEWVWRALNQPKGGRIERLKRIYKAVIVFPLKFIRWFFILPFFYRKNVACLLYKREGDKIYALIVEREYSPGNWQLPQGGRDDQSIIETGERELKEEINNNLFKTKKSYRKVARYKFCDKKNGKYCYKYWGYKGQKQDLYIAEFIGQDSDIKLNYWEHINWRWVDIDKLVAEVSSRRKEATEKFYKLFKDYISKNLQ